MTKSDLRKQIAKQKQQLVQSPKNQSEDGSTACRNLEARSAAILEAFQSLTQFQTAKAIGAYMPLPDEVDVAPAFQWHKQFYIPAFDETTAAYRMARYTPELTPGKFGIPEPANPVWARPDELDLILVPGVAFDRSGNRLGRGGGFYDRLLPLYRAARVAIGFDFQTVNALPTEPHDCRMDFLITESEFLEFAMNS